MPSCSAYLCKARHDKKDPGVSFHKFPKDPKLRKAWVRATCIDDWEPNDYSHLCSAHFRPEDFEPISPFKRTLRKNVVPSIFPQLPSYLQRKLPKERRPIIKHPLHEKKKNKKNETGDLSVVSYESATPNISSTPISEEGNVSKIQSTIQSVPSIIQRKGEKKNRGKRVDKNQSNVDSSVITELVNDVLAIKKRMNVFMKRKSTKNCRMKARIKKLKRSLDELKDDTAKDNAILLSLFENAIKEPELEPESENISMENIEDTENINNDEPNSPSKDKYTAFGLFLANELRQIPADDVNSLKNEIRLLVNKSRWEKY